MRKPPPNTRALTDEQEEILVQRRIAGVAVAALTREYHITAPTVRNILKRRGVTPAMIAHPERRAARKPRPDFREAFEALGDPPEDPILAAEWMHRNLMLAARQVSTDPEYDASPADRNKALVQISRAANAALPNATVAKALRHIRDDAGARDRVKASPEEANAAAITTRADRPPPVRGRPRE
jgi:hypothetical protein